MFFNCKIQRNNASKPRRFGSTGDRRKSARRAISLNERDLMKRSNYKSHHPSLLIDKLDKKFLINHSRQFIATRLVTHVSGVATCLCVHALVGVVCVFRAFST